MGSSAWVWCWWGLVVGAAAFAPWLAPYDPFMGDLQNAYLVEPGGRFGLGTDTQGRDLVSRVLVGARLSLLVSVVTLAFPAEATLSFVGLGAQPPTPSWGAMVADGRDLMARARRLIRGSRSER